MSGLHLPDDCTFKPVGVCCMQTDSITRCLSLEDTINEISKSISSMIKSGAVLRNRGITFTVAKQTWMRSRSKMNALWIKFKNKNVSSITENGIRDFEGKNMKFESLGIKVNYIGLEDRKVYLSLYTSRKKYKQMPTFVGLCFAGSQKT